MNMPVDLGMFLSATGFDYSPFGNDRYTLSYDPGDYSSRLHYPRDHYMVGSRSRRCGMIHDKPVFLAFETKEEPKPPGHKTSVEVPDGTRKKKVSFADDKGLDLVEVREIPGIPKWSDNALGVLIGNQNFLEHEKTWQKSFKCPPWDDSKLLELLKRNKVSLESVKIRRSSVDILSGTIKVENMGFRKNVFVRISFDRWVTYIDSSAEYVKPSQGIKRGGIFDTFYFSMQIPPSASKYGVIEFCVCFQCIGYEYWDNNGGINYRLVIGSPTENIVSRNSSEDLSQEKITVSLTENIENFSEIDAWSNFMCTRPYW